MTLHSSQMGRGGHRDDRRRRLFAEDPTAKTGLPTESNAETSVRNDKPPAHKSQNYGDADFLQTQLRLTDLIPRRLISYLLLFTVGLAAIAGLIALYLWIPQFLGKPHLRPIMADLGGCGSLGNWFASLLLLTAGLLAIVIYSVRRHKVDDYHGHYHIWRWAAVCWFLAATDQAAGLHQCLQQGMISLTGTRIVGDGSIWWMVPTLVLVGTIGARLLIDMRSSRLSSTALVFAGIAYSTSLAVYFHCIPGLPSPELGGAGGEGSFLLLQGTLLGGHLLLAISMGLYARYVVLDAEGALPKRSIKKKAAKKRPERNPDKARAGNSAVKESASGGGSQGDDSEDVDEASADQESGHTWVAVHPPHGTAQPVLKRIEASPVSPLGQRVASAVSASSRPASAGSGSSAAPSGNSDTESNPDDSKLSKAERKALKKKLLEERLTREQRKASNW